MYIKKSLAVVFVLSGALLGVSAALGAVLEVSQDTTWTDLSALDGYDGVAVGEDATLTLELAADAELAKPVSGAGALVKAGAGTLTISAANTFTGVFTISEGTVNAKNDSAFGSADSGTTVGLYANVIFSGITTSEDFTGVDFVADNKVHSFAAIYTVSGSNVLNGDVSLGKQSKILVEAGAKVVFNGTYFGQHIDISTARSDSEVVFNGPYSGYLWNSNPYQGRLVWNVEVRNDFGYNGATLVGGIEYAFYNLNMNLGGGYYANPILDLKGYPQHVKTISPSKILASCAWDSQVKSATKAFLHVADNTQGETLSRLKFTGKAGLCWEGTGSVALTNVMTSTGDLTVKSGSVRFLDRAVSSWENVNEVTLSGVGSLVLADAEQLGVPRKLAFADDGKLTLPANSTMTVCELTVEGVGKAAGEYSASDLEEHLVGEGAKIKVIGSNYLLVSESAVWDDSMLAEFVEGGYGGVDVAAGATLSISNTVDFSLTVPVIGEGALLKDGAGDLHLRSANYFDGTFTVIGTGTVYVHDDDALGSAVGKTIVYLKLANKNGEYITDSKGEALPGATLELCGVELNEPIDLHSSGQNDLVAAANTRNVLNGEVWAYDGSVGLFARSAGSLVFRGGLNGKSGVLYPGTESEDSMIIIENKPMKSGVYFWNGKGTGYTKGGLHFNVPAIPGVSLGYTYHPVTCGAEWALNGSKVHWDTGYHHMKVDLGGYNQRAKSIKSDTEGGGTANGINGYVTSAVDKPAMLYVTDADAEQENRVPFKGSAGFCLDVPAQVLMNAPGCDTVGEIQVLDGEVTMSAVGAWPNCPKVTVAGDGVFAVEAAGAVSRKAEVCVSDDGLIDIPAGVELTVGSFVVDGVELSSGRYSDTEGSATAHFKSGGGTLVVRGVGVKMFVR